MAKTTLCKNRRNERTCARAGCDWRKKTSKTKEHCRTPRGGARHWKCSSRKTPQACKQPFSRKKKKSSCKFSKGKCHSGKKSKAKATTTTVTGATTASGPSTVPLPSVAKAIGAKKPMPLPASLVEKIEKSAKDAEAAKLAAEKALKEKAALEKVREAAASRIASATKIAKAKAEAAKRAKAKADEVKAKGLIAAKEAAKIAAAKMATPKAVVTATESSRKRSGTFFHAKQAVRGWSKKYFDVSRLSTFISKYYVYFMKAGTACSAHQILELDKDPDTDELMLVCEKGFAKIASGSTFTIHVVDIANPTEEYIAVCLRYQMRPHKKTLKPQVMVTSSKNCDI